MGFFQIEEKHVPTAQVHVDRKAPRPGPPQNPARTKVTDRSPRVAISTMDDSLSGRVLSIQSSVVHGYVGNKSAVFPLQIHGFDVDPINTVQLSNHTGWGYFKGQKLQGADLLALMDGLEHNRLLNYTHLLTGYMGSASFLQAVVDQLAVLKTHSPEIMFGTLPHPRFLGRVRDGNADVELGCPLFCCDVCATFHFTMDGMRKGEICVVWQCAIPYWGMEAACTCLPSSWICTAISWSHRRFY
jgi:hypothetical protein